MIDKTFSLEPIKEGHELDASFLDCCQPWSISLLRRFHVLFAHVFERNRMLSEPWTREFLQTDFQWLFLAMRRPHYQKYEV